MNLEGQTVSQLIIRLATIAGQDYAGRQEIAGELTLRLEADAQALADVRTLDTWAAKERGHGHETMQIAGGLYITRLLDAFSLSPTTTDFEGSTPEAARGLAAAWVREQAKGAEP